VAKKLFPGKKISLVYMPIVPVEINLIFTIPGTAQANPPCQCPGHMEAGAGL
jgi:uncharacterized cupredoxin-like copper-binding protein